MTTQYKSNINLPLEEHTVHHFVCKKYGYTKWRTMVCDTQKHTILMDINYVNAYIAQSAQSKGNVPPFKVTRAGNTTSQNYILTIETLSCRY